MRYQFKATLHQLIRPGALPTDAAAHSAPDDRGQHFRVLRQGLVHSSAVDGAHLWRVIQVDVRRPRETARARAGRLVRRMDGRRTCRRSMARIPLAAGPSDPRSS